MSLVSFPRHRTSSNQICPTPFVKPNVRTEAPAMHSMKHNKEEGGRGGGGGGLLIQINPGRGGGGGGGGGGGVGS